MQDLPTHLVRLGLNLVVELGVVLLVDVVVRLVEVRLVTNTLGGVLLGELVDLLKVLLGEVDELEVVLDTGRSDRLGEGVDATLDEPRDEDVGALDRVLVGNLLDDGVVAESLTVSAAERRVSLGEDVLLLEPVDKLELGALDRELDLVGDGLDADVLQELLGAVDVEVGDTDRLDETLVDELLHLTPGGENVVGELDVKETLALGSGLDVLVLGENSLGGIDLPVDLK